MIVDNLAILASALELCVLRGYESRKNFSRPTPVPDRLDPACRRALAAAGIHSLEDLSRWPERDVARLPGVLPTDIAKLRVELGRRGLAFADDE